MMYGGVTYDVWGVVYDALGVTYDVWGVTYGGVAFLPVVTLFMYDVWRGGGCHY